MPRNSFRWPSTHPTLPNVLKTSGYVETNEPGDVKQLEADDFSLTPGLWQWTGSAWIAFTPPPPSDADLGNQFDATPIPKAVALYFLDRINELRALPAINLPAITPGQMRQGIVAKRKGL